MRFAHGAYVGFVWLQNKIIIIVNSINQLIFVMEA